MQDGTLDYSLMIELGQMPAGIALESLAEQNKLKEEIKQSEVDIQNLLNMCASWSWA